MKTNKVLSYFIYLPIVLLAVLIYVFSVNSAHWDDHAVKYSVKNIFESPSIIEQIQLLFKQHNEHRIVTTRLSALLSKAFLGYLDYRFLMFIGFGFLVGITLIINKLQTNLNLKFIGILLIINPSFYENTFWGMASVQNFGVVFFALLAAERISKGKLYLGFLFSVFAVFTSANGIVILIAILLFYLLFREFKKALIWTLLSSVLIFAFYFNFKPNEDLIKTDLTNLIEIQKGFFTLAGSAFDSFLIFSTKRLIFNYLIGFSLTVFSVFHLIQWILKVKTTNQESFIFIALLFIFGTIAGTVLSRLGYGIETLLTSKYKLYSALLLLLNIYLFAFKFPKSKKYLAIFSFLAFCFSYIFDYQKIKNLKQERISENFNNYHSKNIELQDLNFIQKPVEMLELKQIITSKKNQSSEILDIKLVDKNYLIQIKQNAIKDSYILIQNESTKYISPIVPAILGYKALIKNLIDKPQNGLVHIPQSTIKTGNYRISTISQLGKIDFQTAHFQGVEIINNKKNW